MVQFVNSRCSSLMLNHHSITKLIISLTLTLLQCYYFNTLGVDYIYTGSVDLTLEVLLCSNRKGNALHMLVKHCLFTIKLHISYLLI